MSFYTDKITGRLQITQFNLCCINQFIVMDIVMLPVVQ